jgi:hypothetical protein
MERLPHLLIGIGIFFLIVNLRLLYQFIRFMRIRSSALLTWPSRTPRFYRFFIVVGAVLAGLIVYKLVVLKLHARDVFGESMMLVYYSYVPLTLKKIGRGFYQDGIWGESGFMPYSQIGGLTWREGEQVTLVMMSRMRNFASRLVVPRHHYSAARRLLREKIAAHDIHFTGKPLDLGLHDERDDV